MFVRVVGMSPKISLVLPYWARKDAADAALRQLDAVYAGLDLEVIVVDDGNRERYVPPQGALNVRVVHLPEKDVPKCPATAWNAGARVATGEIIVLSCIEILHTKPVLAEMAKAVEDGGPNAYVLAAAWCPEERQYHTHSTVAVPDCPPGTGIAFCAALHRSLFDRAGGYDEGFRDGAGYEDRDFIHRLLAAGAKFTIRDDLEVVHPKTGATIDWVPGGFERNERLFYANLARGYSDPGSSSLAVVCVEVSDYCGRGERYVRTLKAMLERHLTIPHTFYCITDTPKVGINCIEAHPRLPGWWQKLYQFKEGLFREEKVLSFDLDTFIVGNIDRIAMLDTDLAMIRDFWRPESATNGVMMWRNGGLAHLFWDLYDAQGLPQDSDGDGPWMGEQTMPPMKFHLLQDVFPGQFVSYKTECMKHGADRLKAAPSGASIVCFHGDPRPHAAPGWARSVWRQYEPQGAERIAA